MTTDELRRVATFLDGLKKLSEETDLTLCADYLWEEGNILCRINPYKFEVNDD